MSMVESAAVVTVVSMTLALIFFAIQTAKMEEENLESFESGFEDMNEIKQPFSTNFFTMIMLFLIFDVEVSIMVPVMMSSSIKIMMFLLASSVLFWITVLLVKEWIQGAMDWVK